MGSQKKGLIETVLLNAHNICFDLELKTNIWLGTTLVTFA